MRAIAYAAKSTADRHRSITTQFEDVRRMAADREWTIVAEYCDEGFSAYVGNRGPALAAAEAHAARLAHETGEIVVLVAQAADRFARGAGDTPTAPQHLAELWHRCRRLNVHLRSVEDDGDLRDAASVGNLGQRAMLDSRRKSESTRKGKRRRFESGQPLGGPVPDGFILRHAVENGEIVSRYEVDPDRASVIRTIFGLAEAGLTPLQIARKMNESGYRTQLRTSKRSGQERGGRPWQTRRVSDTLRCAAYAGRVVHRKGSPEEEAREGAFPALVDPETFDRVQGFLTRRNLNPDRPRGAGRPPSRHALARLAVCARCGATVVGLAGSYVRVDGTQKRSYVCLTAKHAPGACDLPRLDAERMDQDMAKAARLLLSDFDGWAAAQLQGRDAEVSGLRRALDAEQQAAAKARTRLAAAESQYDRHLDGDEPELAVVAARAVSRAAELLAQAEHRAAEVSLTLEAAEANTSLDDMRDLHTHLTLAVRGLVEGSPTLADLNAALRSVLKQVSVDVVDGTVVMAPIALDPDELVGSRLIVRPTELGPEGSVEIVRIEHPEGNVRNAFV